MYNLHKIVILGGWSPDDRAELQTIALETYGLRVNSVLSIDDANSIGEDGEDIAKDIQDQLYSDMYDDDDLIVKIEEAYDGHDAIRILAKYINKVWDEDLQVYYYLPDEESFALLSKALMHHNGRIYLTNFKDLFPDEFDIEKNIISIMETLGIKTSNLLEGSQVSLSYFLSTLVEILLSR